MTIFLVSTDWSTIWSITLVSFGLVLLILLLLVYVMKIFGLFFTKKNSENKEKAAVAVSKENKEQSDETEVVAAISVAIALAQGALHIEEAGYLTFNSNDRQTAWNNKAYGITRMPEHRQQK